METAFEPIISIRKGWKRIYLDLPGMGKTKGVDEIATQDQILNIISDFADKVIPGQTFSLVGFSYGGYLARGMVFKRSIMMNGLLLVAPLIIAENESRTNPAKVTLVKNPELINKLDPAIAEGFQNLAVVQSQQLLDSYKKDGFPAGQIADQKFLSKLEDNFEFSFDVDSIPEPFTSPTLMVMGRQDHMCGYFDTLGVIENYPRGTFAVLDRAGHGLMLEQNTVFTALVNEWLDRVEEHIKNSK